MEYSHANVIRPFLATRKSELIDYAQTHQIPWLEDPSNQDVEFAARNRIRHDMLPSALLVNPGLHNMVRKRIIEKLGRV
jgi:tRNA(Ile)-lysidine synthase